MRISNFAILALAAGLMAAGPAHADNDIGLLANDPLANVATLTISGDLNVFSGWQTHEGTGPANELSLTITGDLNGGPLGSSFTGLAAGGELTPGRLEQTGYGNFMGITINGDGNLFAALQSGSANTLTATIIGHNNQATVTQMGRGNNLSFSQMGSGNVLSVVQRSW